MAFPMKIVDRKNRTISAEDVDVLKDIRTNLEACLFALTRIPHSKDVGDKIQASLDELNISLDMIATQVVTQSGQRPAPADDEGTQ